jgi:hypothetical protein
MSYARPFCHFLDARENSLASSFLSWVQEQLKATNNFPHIMLLGSRPIFFATPPPVISFFYPEYDYYYYESLSCNVILKDGGSRGEEK